MSSIRDYWISEIKETLQFKAIADSEDVDLSILEGHLENLLNDQFIETATEEGIARREKLLKITPKAQDSKETRRRRVGFMWDNQLPYTYNKLIQQLDSIAKGQYLIILDHNSYTLSITLELNYRRLVDAVEEVASEMMPANLVLIVELRYNTHQLLSNFTRGWLGAFTHFELRNEVIPTPLEGITNAKMENFTHERLEDIYHG